MKRIARLMMIGLSVGMLSGGLLAQEPAVPEGMMELKPELPRPLFVGTPTNIVSSNLEEMTGQPRKPLLVPADVKLLSRDKYVTSSDSAPIIGDLQMITDGDKEGVDGSYVEIGPKPQWVQIDLEEEYELHAIVVWHYHSQARAYKDVVVMTAEDEDMLDGVTLLMNNDHDNTLGLGLGTDKEWIETYEGRMIDAKGVRGRFVRLHSNGSTASPMSHYVEVEVYGRAPASE
jgi:hypothetical protein